ncbi:MAG: cytochrome c3 family protein [Planctomycetes bacterium]|nr:cytochrome c3 family protein [Planctomycetota bacterium]MBI3845513.1 cytochrome c3 family protein [Planctomycetota bacterium]
MRTNGTTISILFTVSLAAAAPRSNAQDGQATAQKTPETSCVRCHKEIAEDLGPQVAEWETSVHAAVGLSCNDCHGGDPTADDMLKAKRKDAGYVGAPKKRAEVGPFCARCHSDIEYMRRFNPSMRVDQLTEYLTSRHGKAVHQEGSDKAATCTDCHGKHAILRVSDPRSSVSAAHVAETCARCHADAARMATAKLPTDIYEKWKGSVHGQRLAGGDLSAPTCNDCHGNHGAMPPGVRDVVHVCGRCHVTQEEHFTAGSHRAPFEKLGKAPCITCHSNHDIQHASDALLASQPPGVCGKCHKPDDVCDRAAKNMLGGIVRLTSGMKETEDVLGRAEQFGMDVSEPRFRLSDVRDRLTMARVVVHRFNEKEFADVLAEGEKTLTGIRKQGDAALDEWEFRRKGLAFSLILIVAVIVLLALKVRSLERARRNAQARAPEGAASVRTAS